MNLIYPKFPVGRLPAMLRMTVLGAVVAGGYGAVHDQISYTISPEYFTKLKFPQFQYADFGWSPRPFAAVVGFLATWWIGLIAGWLLARSGLTELPLAQRAKCTAQSFGIMLALTASIGFVGAMLGVATTRAHDLDQWSYWRLELGVEDLRGFVVVAYLHAAGYFGALLGLVSAIVYVRRCCRRPPIHR